MDPDDLSNESVINLCKALFRKGRLSILNKPKINISANNNLRGQSLNLTMFPASSASQSQPTNQVAPASDQTSELSLNSTDATTAFTIQRLQNGTNVVQPAAPGPGQFRLHTDFAQRPFRTPPDYGPGPFAPGAILRVSHEEASPELRARVFCVLNTTDPDPSVSESMAALTFCRHTDDDIRANERHRKTHMRAYNGELRPHRGDLNLHLEFVRVFLEDGDLRPDIWLDVGKVWDLSNNVQCAQIGSLTKKALKYVQREMWNTYAPNVFGPNITATSSLSHR